MGDPSSSREERTGDAPGSTDATVEIDTLAERLAVSSVWANRIAYSVVLIGVAIGAALMASPGLSSQKIPELKSDDVGKVFRATGMSGRPNHVLIASRHRAILSVDVQPMVASNFTSPR